MFNPKLLVLASQICLGYGRILDANIRSMLALVYTANGNVCNKRK